MRPEMTYDAEADALYVRLSGNAPHEAYDAGGLIVHVDMHGRIVAVEALGASRVLAPGDWRSAPAPSRESVAAE